MLTTRSTDRATMGNAKSAPKNKTGKSVVKLVSRGNRRDVLMFHLLEFRPLLTYYIYEKENRYGVQNRCSISM